MYTENFNKPCRCNLRAFRLIFMDLNMPVMDGKEASRRILELVRKDVNTKLPYSHCLPSDEVQSKVSRVFTESQ